MSLRIAAVTWLLLVTVVSLCPRPAVAQEAAYLELYVNRYEEGGRILIQMRDIFEWLGWVVEWDPYERAVTAYGEGYTMSLWVDNYQAIVNGQVFALDVPPRLILGRTLVPLRFVAEVTGCQVDYLGNAVQISDEVGNVLMIYLV
ncbi:MAG: copper amine oxidase N-terminal domain-containing protein [Armatimonadota bacterium]